MGIDNTFDFIRQFNLFRLVFMALPGKTLSLLISIAPLTCVSAKLTRNTALASPQGFCNFILGSPLF
jgi:hypothetical protein